MDWKSILLSPRCWFGTGVAAVWKITSQPRSYAFYKLLPSNFWPDLLLVMQPRGHLDLGEMRLC